MFKKLIECFFCWKVRPRGDLRKAQVIVAQSFGCRENEPGISNETMARLAWKIRQKLHLSMILQWEIAEALPEKSRDLWIIERHREEGKYLDTYEVLDQAKEIIKEQGWRTAVLIAHPWQIWRAMAVFKKMGIKIIIPNLDSIPFNPESTQWWTRNMFLWILREIPTRLLYLIKSWI